MRSLTLWIVLCCALTLATHARAQRGLPGQVGLGVAASLVDGMTLCTGDGQGRFAVEAALTRYNRNHSYWSFTASLLRKDYRYRSIVARQIVPMAQFAVEAAYNHPLLHDRARTITLFAGVGALAGYETVGWGRKLLTDGARLRSDDGFIYGLSLAASLEAYLSDRVILLLRLRERCAFGSSTGQFHTQVGIGFRFIIN